MTFNPRDYTAQSIIKQFSLIELHGKDGSAVNAGCGCIEEKHLINIEGLSEEGVGFALSEQEKIFYQWVSDLARNLRIQIGNADWRIPCNPVPGAKCTPMRVRHVTD